MIRRGRDVSKTKLDKNRMSARVCQVLEGGGDGAWRVEKREGSTGFLERGGRRVS